MSAYFFGDSGGEKRTEKDTPRVLGHVTTCVELDVVLSRRDNEVKKLSAGKKNYSVLPKLSQACFFFLDSLLRRIGLLLHSQSFVLSIQQV